MNEENVMELVQLTGGYMAGAAVSAGVQLGDAVGYYRAMAGAGALSADAVAAEAGCNPRLTREWLDGQAAAGLIALDPAADTYTLTDEAAMVLADESSPVFLARGIQGLTSVVRDMDKLVEAFTSDGALPWGAHHECLFKGTEWFFRAGYRAHLTNDWIPALDGVHEMLTDGARVADVGCGHGASIVVMANAYPNSTFTGVDYHRPSVEVAAERAAEAGVGDRCDWTVADATSYEGTYDLVCFFDCLHDMGDPVGAARHAHKSLAPGGSVLLVEPFAVDGRAANIAANPFASMLYTVSSMVCTPNSLSQDVGLGLGAQAGEQRMREIFADAGFSGLERRTETPFNLIMQATV